MNASLDTIKDLLKRAGGSVIIDKQKGAFLDYDNADGIDGEEYVVYAKEIYLKGERIYAKCARAYSDSDLYDAAFTEEYLVNSSNIENIKDEIYRSLVKADTELGMRAAALPDLSRQMIKELSHINNPEIRASIASREDIPSNILNNLLKDRDPFVKGAAMIHSIEKNLSLLPVGEWVFLIKEGPLRYSPEEWNRPRDDYEYSPAGIFNIRNAGVTTNGKRIYVLADRLCGSKHEVDSKELHRILSYIPKEEILEAIHDRVQNLVNNKDVDAIKKIISATREEALCENYYLNAIDDHLYLNDSVERIKDVVESLRDYGEQLEEEFDEEERKKEEEYKKIDPTGLKWHELDEERGYEEDGRPHPEDVFDRANDLEDLIEPKKLFDNFCDKVETTTKTEHINRLLTSCLNGYPYNPSDEESQIIRTLSRLTPQERDVLYSHLQITKLNEQQRKDLEYLITIQQNPASTIEVAKKRAEDINLGKYAKRDVIFNDMLKDNDGLSQMIKNVYYLYLNSSSAAETKPLSQAEIDYQKGRLSIKRIEEGQYIASTRKIREIEEYEVKVFPLIEKYCSLSGAERLDLTIDSNTAETAEKLNYLSMIRENPDCLPNLRLREQEIRIMDKQADYSCNLDNCQAVYPGTQDKLFSCPPYVVTDVEFSTPPYADGKPLNECPGWTGLNADWGHIDSITIENGNHVSKKFSGEMIDKENRLVFELEDMTIKYGIETGKAEFYPHLKKSETQTQAVQHKPKTPEPPKPKHRGMHM